MVSHHHKAIFVHIPKCAGQSIETAFLQDLGLSWKTRAPLLLRANPTPELGPPRLAHLLARDYVKFRYVTEDQFSQYYKFSVVRSPISRVISLYNYMSHMRRNAGFRPGLEQFVHDWLPSQFSHAHKYAQENNRYEDDFYFVRPQYDYLHSENGELLVDDVFALDDLSARYPEIRSRCGLKSDLRHINAPKAKLASTRDLKPADIEVVRDLYAPDFRLLEGKPGSDPGFS